MYILKFWKAWPPIYQRLWWIALVMFIASLAIAVAAWIEQPAPVFTWQQLQELRREEISIYNVDVGGIDIPVMTENYILFERWLGMPIQLNGTAIDIYLFLFTGAFIMLMALLSVLPRFWFMIGAGILLFILASFQFETLGIFGLENKLPTIFALIAWMTPGLYFQFSKTGASLKERILVFFIVTIVLGLVIANFSNALQPLRSLAINTIPASIVLIVVFIILVAHEIAASFVSLVGNGTSNSKSSRHYFILSGIYLANLWLAYLERINVIEWAFTIPPILLLMISGILGLWGIRQRQFQYENIISSDPFAVLFIASLGTISFGAIGYFIVSSNDVVLLSLSDLILYAHIGYGMIFLTYVIANFLPMLAANYQVYRVLYKPTAMPYFSYRIAGLIFTLAILFYNNWIVPVNHFRSGYYTSMGDLYTLEGNSTLATGYYSRAYFYATYNQHAATALGELEALKNNSSKQKKYLDGANSYRQNEFTEVAAANTFSERPIDEIITLQEAKRRLPKSGIVKNNLGLAYLRLGLIDSAYLLFNQAKKNKLTEASAEMNLVGLFAENKLIVNTDSIYRHLGKEQDRVKSNVVAIANGQSTTMDIPADLPKDSLLDLFSASFIGNYITNHVNKPDTTFLGHCVRLARKKENRPFAEIILVPASKAFYAAGQISRAIALLQEASFTSGKVGTHNSTTALWLLDQGKPDIALLNLNHTAYTSAQSPFVAAVTLTEVGKINEAILAWDTLHYNKDTLLRATSESMKRVLAGPVAGYAGFTDKEKYKYLRYRIAQEDSTQFNSLLNQISSEDLKAKAIFDRSKKWFDRDEISKAAYTYLKIQGLHLTDLELFAKIKYYELRLLSAQGKWSAIETQINKGLMFGPYLETERIYFEGLIFAAAGDTVKAAKNFEWLARNNPYFDEGIVTAAAFFKDHGADKRKSYKILSEALQANPSSIKILKAYIPEAKASEYTEYASSALQTLKALISTSAYRSFVEQNRLSALPFQ
ncbi:hypothetical protein BH10BAC4_BH10BAC4_14700 [soil metagenome]